MTNDPTAKTLAELGVTDTEGVVRLFREVRGQFEKDAEHKKELAAWEALRASWVGRKSGVLNHLPR